MTNKNPEILKEMPSEKKEIKELVIFPGFDLKNSNQIEAKTLELQKLAGELKEVDKYSFDRAKGYKKKVMDHYKRIEETRVNLKAPALEACNMIEAQANKFKEPLVILKNELTDKITAFSEAEEKRKQEEKERVQGIINGFLLIETQEELKKYFKALLESDRKKKQIAESFRDRKLYLEEQEKLRKMKEEQAEIEKKIKAQEDIEIEKISKITSFEQMQHMEDYIENMYGRNHSVPIENAVSLKIKELRELESIENKKLEDLEKQTKAEAEVKEIVVEKDSVLPEKEVEVKNDSIQANDTKNAISEEKEPSLFEKFDYLCSKINFADSNLDSIAITYMNDLFIELKKLS